ncbi:MAG: hypothetical protein ACFB0A_06380, partial [Croceivirga sp.]
WFITAGLGILTSVLIPFGEEVWKWNYVNALKYTALIFFIVYLLRFVVIALKESIKYFHSVYQESVYGEAIILLKHSFAEAHFYRKTPEFNNEDFMRSMIVFCNNLKKIYDRITKVDCSVSIKVPVKGSRVDAQTLLKNLTRDKDHVSRDTKIYESTNHTILGNSAFSNCLDSVLKGNKEKFYINNDVNQEKNYLNSSKVCYNDGILPYNSELVHPIVPLKTVDNKNFDCHGFICVDSTKSNAFQSKYDSAILEGVADGIYDIIEQLNSQPNVNNSKPKIPN